MKKYLAEMIGTMVLVLMGCGTAVSLSCGVDTASVVGTALAFGLAVVGMAYAIGGISGCHINPAITLGVWLSKRMSGKDAAMYMLFQVIGAFIGAGILMALAPESGLGANALYQEDIVMSLVIEAILTFVFVLAILGVTSKKEYSSVAGVVIGLSLTLVHILGIAFTGTSVNPARSFGPALFLGLFTENSDALVNVWVFIVGPLVGGILAALVYMFLAGGKKKEEIEE